MNLSYLSRLQSESRKEALEAYREKHQEICLMGGLTESTKEEEPSAINFMYSGTRCKEVADALVKLRKELGI